MCGFCEKLKKLKGDYDEIELISGYYGTRMYLEKIKDKFQLNARGDGEAELEICFCPKCGKKLSEL